MRKTVLALVMPVQLKETSLPADEGTHHLGLQDSQPADAELAIIAVHRCPLPDMNMKGASCNSHAS